MSVKNITAQDRLSDYPTNQLSSSLLCLSDYLSKPFFALCQTYQWMKLVNRLHAAEGALLRSARKVVLAAQMLFWSLIAFICLLPAFLLRSIGNYRLKHAFLYARGTAGEKLIDENQCSFTLLSWNVCCIPGFSLESGVVPYPLRIEAIAQRIIQENCDVVCLYEVFETIAAEQIQRSLAASGYTHFYFNIGPNNLGLNSGLFVASKCAVQNPQFVPFKNQRHIQRGVFSFDLLSASRRFTRIFTTHLHPSKEPKAPSFEEIILREGQMACILEQLPKEEICMVIAGDLNLDDVERLNSSWYARFDKGEVIGGKSWGGDLSSTEGLNLDYVMVVKSPMASINTAVKTVGFDPRQLSKEALSDHATLCSQVHFHAPQSQSL